MQNSTPTLFRLAVALLGLWLLATPLSVLGRVQTAFGESEPSGEIEEIVADDSVVYVSAGHFQVLDISEPAAPRLVVDMADRSLSVAAQSIGPYTNISTKTATEESQYEQSQERRHRLRAHQPPISGQPGPSLSLLP